MQWDEARCLGLRSLVNPLFVGECANDCIVGGLRLVSAVEGKRSTLGVVGVGADPGIFVGEAPGLNGGATGTLQACSYDGAINLSLPGQVIFRGCSIGVYRQGDVEFRDVDLDAECGQARNI